MITKKRATLADGVRGVSEALTSKTYLNCSMRINKVQQAADKEAGFLGKDLAHKKDIEEKKMIC